ncbi:MAG: hypothetical protein ACT4O1_07910, partial [Gemmatimonadota bacterium]
MDRVLFLLVVLCEGAERAQLQPLCAVQVEPASAGEHRIQRCVDRAHRGRELLVVISLPRSSLPLLMKVTTMPALKLVITFSTIRLLLQTIP